MALSRRALPGPFLNESLPLSDLHAALARADVVVVAMALVAQTHRLLGAAEFAACRRGALLVNIARGAVPDQAALSAALQSGQLGGAGLDVTDPEPLPSTDPLWGCPNVLISPHYGGGGSAASTARLAVSVVGNLRRLMAGQVLTGLVQAA